MIVAVDVVVIAADVTEFVVVSEIVAVDIAVAGGGVAAVAAAIASAVTAIVAVVVKLMEVVFAVMVADSVFCWFLRVPLSV